MWDLNDLINSLSDWVLTHASGINDAGQITAHGSNRLPFEGGTLLLTPVPLPAGWGLLLSSVARRGARTG